MEKNISLLVYLESLFKNIDCTSTDKLINIINERMGKENDYWGQVDNDYFSNWFFVRLTRFESENKIHVGFTKSNKNPKKITINIFSDFYENEFDTEYYKLDLDLYKSWIDKDFLYKKLSSIFFSAIMFSQIEDSSEKKFKLYSYNEVEATIDSWS